MNEDARTIDDEILAGRILSAIIGIRAELGCALGEAIHEFKPRYDRLRAERPDDFTKTPEEYFEGFYS